MVLCLPQNNFKSDLIKWHMKRALKFSNEHRKQSQIKIIIVVVVVGVVDVVNQISVKHMLTYFSFNIYEACKLCVQRPAVKKKIVYAHDKIHFEMHSTNDKMEFNIGIGTCEKRMLFN